MTEIRYFQNSPKGTATLDTARLAIAPDGTAYWIDTTGPKPLATPAGPEQVEALRSHFGIAWRDALDAVAALDEG